MTPRRRRRLAAACITAALRLCGEHHAVRAWAPRLPSTPPPSRRRSGAPHERSRRFSSSAEDGGGASGPASGVANEDWREFRAQLVRAESEGAASSKARPERREDEDHWAYETGDFVERGSLVVAVPSSNEYLDDVDALNSVCYRKAVVLVLDAGPRFLQGIVLNRPTNIGVAEGMQLVRPGHGEVFENDLMEACIGDLCEVEEEGPSSGARWKVWFGGEVGGPYSDHPQILCLHTIATETARAVSNAVLPGMFLTSYDGAQRIVREGDADPSDFWLFCGTVGWEAAAFYEEMHEEGLWHVVAADSGTTLEELHRLRCEEAEDASVARECDVDSDPRNAGLHTWEMLMEKIGLADEARASEGSFGDLMLHEWATGALAFNVEEETGGGSAVAPGPEPGRDAGDFELSTYDPAASMAAAEAVGARRPPDDLVGTVVRASSATRSPYLFADQGFHKSLMLVARDGDDRAEGLLLNHVTSRTLRLDLGDGTTVDLPLRYGGPARYYVEDEDNEDDDERGEAPTVFLHADAALREAGIGAPVGKGPLFRCTKEEAIEALATARVNPSDLMAVRGCSVWAKEGEHTGIASDVAAGYFDFVPGPEVARAWDLMSRQEGLTEDNLEENAARGRAAWKAAGGEAAEAEVSGKGKVRVFGTDVDVAALADEAAMRWAKINLL